MTGLSDTQSTHSIDATGAAVALLSRQYAFVPFDRRSTLRVQELFRDFLARKTPEERARWTCFIEDPDDPDYGYRHKGEKEEEDSKHCFHALPVLRELLSQKGVIPDGADLEFLRECERLYDTCSRLVRTVAESIDRVCGLPISFAEELNKSAVAPAPFSRSTLRLAEYDSTESSVRAQVHRDRSLITLPAGDMGGKFFRYSDEAGNVPEVIDTPPGMTVVFFGLKAELMTGGLCRALWHGAEAEVGEDRSICTYFAHANYELQHSREV